MHSNDPLAEMLGEECVMAATSGEEAYSEDVDGVTTEEFGGPFSVFSLETEPAARPTLPSADRNAEKPTDRGGDGHRKGASDGDAK